MKAWTLDRRQICPSVPCMAMMAHLSREIVVITRRPTVHPNPVTAAEILPTKASTCIRAHRILVSREMPYAASLNSRLGLKFVSYRQKGMVSPFALASIAPVPLITPIVGHKRLVHRLRLKPVMPHTRSTLSQHLVRRMLVAHQC